MLVSCLVFVMKLQYILFLVFLPYNITIYK